MILKVYQTLYSFGRKLNIITKLLVQIYSTNHFRIQIGKATVNLSSKTYFTCVMGYTGNVISIFITVYLLQQVSVVYNKGLVKFRDIVISNGTTTLANGGCCKSCICSIVFNLCLMAFDGGNVCLINGNSTKVVTSQVAEMFIELRGTYEKPMRLHLDGIDKNSPKNDNLLFRIEDHKSLSFVDSRSWSLSYKSKNINISFEYELSCFEDHYGPNCNFYCKSRNDNFGHYTCDKTGKRICLYGWVGDYCEIRSCQGKCYRGDCDLNRNKCVCRAGWRGARCNQKIDICSSKCQNGGRCKNGNCQCKYGYHGKFCEKRLPSTSTPKIQPSSTKHMSRLTSIVRVTTMKLNSVFQNTYSQFDGLYTVAYSSSSRITFSTNSLHSFKRKLAEDVSPTLTVSKTFTENSLSFSQQTVSELIASTSWITITKSSSVSVIPTKNKISIKVPVKSNILVISLSSIFLLLLLIGIIVLFVVLWQKNKLRRGTSPQSLDGALINPDHTESLKSVPSGLSIDTRKSAAFPILKDCDEDSGADADGSELDLISVLNYPNQSLPSTPNIDFEKYTLQAVDRMCWETIRGNTTTPIISYNKSKRRKKSKVHSAKKTFSNASTKSQTSSGYCSSEYNSSHNSPASKSASSSRSQITEGVNSENSFTSMMRLIHDISEHVAIIPNEHASDEMLEMKLRIPGNFEKKKGGEENAVFKRDSLNNNTDVEISSPYIVHNEGTERTSPESLDSEFHHSPELFKSGRFEGLPGFICYQDDEML